MLYSKTDPAEKRRILRERLASGELLRFPGAFNPLSARLIERKGFDGVYISGAVLSADLGLPDIGLTTLSEVAGRGEQIARMTELPAIIDADTGFGEPMNVARTIQQLETAREHQYAARSRIMDADFAAETANLTRAQILQQSGTAMVAQANSVPQNVLSLLN